MITSMTNLISANKLYSDVTYVISYVLSDRSAYNLHSYFGINLATNTDVILSHVSNNLEDHY